MKNTFFKIAAILATVFISFNTKAQCPPGETEVTIEFSSGGYYYYGPLIQWDYISGGFISGDGPFGENDVVTTCVPDGDLLIVGCDEQYGFGWYSAEFTVTITEDGSVNGCGAQNGCILYLGNNSNIPYVESCYFGTGSPTDLVAQIGVGPCDASPILTMGCTDPAAPNYNACAITDDGSCLLPTSNDNCIDAIPLTVEPTGSCPGYSIPVNNTGNTPDYTPSCTYAPPVADLFYSFIVPPSGGIDIFTNPFNGGIVNATVLDACNGIEYFCDFFVFNGTAANLPVGAELILQLWQNDPGNFDLCIQEAPPPPPNDICENAVPICGTTDGSNISATSDINDPLTSCIGSLENTVWYSFEADGSGNPITIEILQGDCGGYGYYPFPVLQTHIISGNCGGLFTEEDCSNGDFGYYYYYSSEYTLTLPNPVAGVQYYVYIDGNGGSECDFTIEPSGGIQACCGPDFSLSPVCQLGDDTGFYVDIQVNDIGDNPSGYSINGGAFPDVTSTGTVTIGPFSNGTTTITIEGLDDATCAITREIDFDCACDPLAVTASDDGLICEGDDYEATVVLEDVIPGGFTGVYTVTTDPPGSCTAVPTGAVTEVSLGDDDFSAPIPLGFNFDYWENTYTDFYIGSNGYVTFGSGSPNLGGGPIPDSFPPNNIIALFWTDLLPGNYYGYGSGIISYYNATVNGQNCMVVEFNDVPHYPGYGTPAITGQIIMCEDGTITINCIDCPTNSYYGYYYYYGNAISGIENSDGTAGYFDPALVDGQFTGAGTYTACTTFTPEVTDPSPCNFLYWITDLNDPAGSIASTDEAATFNPTTTTTYYAVVECENEVQCIDEVTVTVDDPVNCGSCDDEIAGQIIAPFECDLSNITVVISIINDDGSETIVGNATTDTNGNYTLPGGPFACGDYSAMLMLPLPDCYADAGGNTGPVGPINFTVDGDGGADGANFIINPEIPTLSQWGLIILALLMMSFGAIKILFANRYVRQIQ